MKRRKLLKNFNRSGYGRRIILPILDRNVRLLLHYARTSIHRETTLVRLPTNPADSDSASLSEEARKETCR